MTEPESLLCQGLRPHGAAEPPPAPGGCATPFDESDRVTPIRLRRFLLAAASKAASDVTIQTDACPRLEIDGRIHFAGRRPWSAAEVATALCELHHAPNAAAEILGRRILDFSYELPTNDGRKQRFRINATGIHARDGSGIEISIRVLPAASPDMEFVRLSSSEVSAMSPPSGLVVIAGATGSGKSATMAAITRMHLETSGRPVKIVDIQAPIEYTYRDVFAGIGGTPSIIGQSEVGRHIPDFASGVWSALRRKPGIINVGEARDHETISAAIEAALTGHLVYTTTHAGSVHDCFRRLLSAFSPQERDQRAYDLGTCLRFVMVQHLVQRAGGQGRIPLREWLSLTGPVREFLLREQPSRWPELIHAIMTRRQPAPQGLFKTLKDSARMLLDQGLICREDTEFKTGLVFDRDRTG